ncbi:MAG: hypothetical protein JOY54_01725 [Acidobacteriaceae bacterium]|nr:hypothetical protein [Acidobacteriaceae bacterium]
MVATEQMVLAVLAALGGAILMLLLGTQILDWYWLVLLGVLGLAIAAVRIRARRLTKYAVAQVLDRRLELNDSLSTAWFLLAGDHGDEPFAPFQIQQADELAARVRPDVAFPFTGRRMWVLAGALAAVAFGLFAVRYLVTSSLSLRQAIIPLHFDAMLEHVREMLPAGRYESAQAQADARQTKLQGPGAPRDDAERMLRTPGSAEPGTPDPNSRSQVQTPGQPANAQTSELNKNSLNAQEREADASKEAQAGSEQNREQNGPQQAANTKELQDSKAGNQQDSNGLLNRIKDALSSLIEQMRPNSAGQKTGENARNSGEKKTGDQVSNSNQQGTPTQQSGTDQQAREQDNAQGAGQATEKPATAQGANADQMAQKKSSDSQSGAGRQDGDKALKEAEEEKAMGKLAALIGKRSASATGDMTVENGSGKQELQTQYTGRVGAHSDTGGEINRDEIPVELQQYVRDYMEQVRKQTKNQ